MPHPFIIHLFIIAPPHQSRDVSSTGPCHRRTPPACRLHRRWLGRAVSSPPPADRGTRWSRSHGWSGWAGWPGRVRSGRGGTVVTVCSPWSEPCSGSDGLAGGSVAPAVVAPGVSGPEVAGMVGPALAAGSDVVDGGGTGQPADSAD